MAYEFPKSKPLYIWRGITHACPRCGCRNTHTRYFSIRENCPRCNLKFEKEPGYWTGSLAINTVATIGIVAVVFVIGIIMTVPDIPVIPLMSILFPLAIVLPIVQYPFTHTLWMAIDHGFMSLLDKS